MPAQHVIRVSLAVLAAGASLALSWPYWRDFSYWPESHAMWRIYFIVGFALAVYVVYVFLGSLRTLFEHDRLERAERAAMTDGTAASTEDAS